MRSAAAAEAVAELGRSLENMWPFKRKPVVPVSPEIQSYDEARSKLKELCERLEAQSGSTDSILTP